MKKLLFIFGTRPEAIKLAPVIIKAKRSRKFNVKVCVTAQHREMLDQVLNIFNIKPDYDLNIMQNNQNLFDITVNSLKKLEPVLRKEKPDIVIVQGDTTTTFVAALSAYYLKIKIAHVEAGLRTKNKFNPFPEEINRQLTDCLADIYFVPTKRAKLNLLSEGFENKKIFVTGNTVVDALLMIVEKQNSKRVQEFYENYFLKNFGISFDSKRTILVTAHRRESFGKDFESICKGLKMIADDNPNVQIIYPVHLNPNVQKPVRKILSNSKNVHLIKPLDYLSFVWLMNKSYIILTDSGGIQEEAPSLGKPVLVMRKTTERPEGIEAGVARLIGVKTESIYFETMELLNNEILYQKMSRAVNPYGDGKASERMIEILRKEMRC
ncbi:MAG: UDP-N-acetylglucosamine 2-epimerase (non-hydrolyzing) [Candidatus Aenigmatarchaeota archaeon]